MEFTNFDLDEFFGFGDDSNPLLMLIWILPIILFVFYGQRIQLQITSSEIKKKEATVTIQNIVASINLGGKIHLEQAARTLPRSMYEPEQFPGLIHRMLDPKTVILLFSSGKLVCTGAKKEPDVFRSVNNLHALLEELELMIYE